MAGRSMMRALSSAQRIYGYLEHFHKRSLSRTTGKPELC